MLLVLLLLLLVLILPFTLLEDGRNLHIEVGHSEEVTQRLHLRCGIAHLMDDIFLELIAWFRGIIQLHCFTACCLGLVKEHMTTFNSRISLHLIVISGFHKIGLHRHIGVKHLEHVVVGYRSRFAGIPVTDHAQVAQLVALVRFHDNAHILSRFDQAVSHLNGAIGHAINTDFQCIAEGSGHRDIKVRHLEGSLIDWHRVVAVARTIHDKLVEHKVVFALCLKGYLLAFDGFIAVSLHCTVLDVLIDFDLMGLFELR